MSLKDGNIQTPSERLEAILTKTFMAFATDPLLPLEIPVSTFQKKK